MPTPTETFDLGATVNMVLQAFTAVICNIGYQVAVAGLAVALVIGVLGFACHIRGRRSGRPLLIVCRKLAIICGCLAVPGLMAIFTQGRLPQVNQLVLNPFGLVGFWGLVTAHLCMEEMNFQWYLDK
jgi:hypothetical protein